MNKKITAVLLSAAVLTSACNTSFPVSVMRNTALTAHAEDAPASGTCGENLTWSYDTETKTLTVSGEGNMESYLPDAQPWAPYLEQIAAVVLENGVTAIGTHAFSGCSLTAVSIADTVTVIGESAFSGCEALTGVTIPESVTLIRDCAFQKCTALTAVTVPAGVTVIEGYAFARCTLLSQVTLAEGLTEIGDFAFAGCSALESITVPASVTAIGSSTFYSCADGFTICGFADSYAEEYAEKNKIPFVAIEDTPESPTEGTCGENLTWVYDTETKTLTISGEGEMEDYDGFGSSAPWRDFREVIETVVIEDGVTNIAQEAFTDLGKLSAITIPNSLTSIEPYALYGCTSLIELIIPDSVTEIGINAFSGCSSLQTVILPNGLTNITYHVLYNCTSLTDVTIPESVTSIGWESFATCVSLTQITIPASVTEIGENAFYRCGYDGETGTIDFTIYGYAGSYAEIYAFENEIPFVAIEDEPEPAPTFGNPDGDDEISLSDALTVLELYAKAITGLSDELTDEMVYACDVTGDGQISLEDAICVLKYYTYTVLLHEEVTWYEITGNPNAPDAPAPET